MIELLFPAARAFAPPFLGPGLLIEGNGEEFVVLHRGHEDEPRADDGRGVAGGQGRLPDHVPRRTELGRKTCGLSGASPLGPRKRDQSSVSAGAMARRAARATGSISCETTPCAASG